MVSNKYIMHPQIIITLSNSNGMLERIMYFLFRACSKHILCLLPLSAIAPPHRCYFCGDELAGLYRPPSLALYF